MSVWLWYLACLAPEAVADLVNMLFWWPVLSAVLRIEQLLK